MKLLKSFEPYQAVTRLGPLAVAILMTACASMAPPIEQIAVSKAAVNRAASAGGNEYAAVELKSAADKMTAAEAAMSTEDYLRAQRLAEEALVDARLAETKTGLAKAQLAVSNTRESNRVLREETRRNAP